MNGKRPYRSVKMNMQDTLRFISEVKQHRCLWDTTHEEYKNKNKRDKAWEALSLSLKYNADDLVTKWKSLQSCLRQYRSNLRKRARESGGSDELMVVKWPYYSAMSFNIKAVEELRVINLPRDIRSKSEYPSYSRSPPANQEPNAHSSDNEIQIHRIHDTDSSDEYEPSQDVPTKILKSDPISAPDLVHIKVVKHQPTPYMVTKQKLMQLKNRPSIARPPVPATSQRVPKEPEFVAIKVEPNDPSLPVEQTFQAETHDCSMLKTKDEDDVYGHSIALQMKQFSPRTKRKLQIQIHELIAKAQKQAFEKDFGFSYDSS